MLNFLEAKITEELIELTESGFKDVDDYGDVIEVLIAMANFQGINEHLIESARVAKLEYRGGFDKCLILKE